MRMQRGKTYRPLAPTKLGRGCGDRDSRGFTLLEVILAIAILALSLTMISEVSHMAFRNARGATDNMQASLVARSVMAELQAGTRELVDAGPTAIEGEVALQGWRVQVIVEPCVTVELLQIRVLVGQPEQRTACELVRWFPNPDYVLTDAGSEGAI